MKELVLSKSISLIKQYNSYSINELEKIKYGLEGIYLTFTKLLVIFLIAFAINIEKEIIYVLLLFNIIRFPAFGVHADKSIICLILSIIFFIGLTYLIINIPLLRIEKLIICGFCLISFFLFAPADTHKRPIKNAKKRIIWKYFSIFAALLYSIIIVSYSNFKLSNFFLISLIIESIMINPMMYKLLKVPYNNYK